MTLFFFFRGRFFQIKGLGSCYIVRYGGILVEALE